MKLRNFWRPTVILLLTGCLSLNLQAAQAAASATTAIEQGNRLWEEGKLEEAQKRFEEAVKAEPKSINALMKLAGIQVTRLTYSNAIATYRDVLAIDPKYAKAWMGMGMCYLHSGDREMARAAFDEALKAEPGRKAQIEPVLAQLDEKIQAKRAATEAMMPADANHKGKAPTPTIKPAKPSSAPAAAAK
jgi:Tfp pilus assembly protein PilF